MVLFYLDDLDIGDFIGTALDDITKYKLLTNYFKPYHNYEFSSRFQHMFMRALNYYWLPSFPFLICSKQYDSVFCLPCTLFDKFEISQKIKFYKNAGFSSWFKINEKVSKHFSFEENSDETKITNYSKHSLMMAKAKGLIQSFQNPTATTPDNFHAARETQISKNQEILK